MWYWRNVHAIYYSGMNLRAFPFDSQQLLVQMEVPQVRASAGSSHVLQHPRDGCRRGCCQLTPETFNIFRLAVCCRRCWHVAGAHGLVWGPGGAVSLGDW